MTVQVIKTKAEQALASRIAAHLASPSVGPGERAVREAAAAEFQVRGLPHRRIEEWKYTDLRNLVKDVDGGAGSIPREALEIAQRLGFEGVDTDTTILIDGRVMGRPGASVAAGVSIEKLSDAIASNPALLDLALPATVDPGQKSMLALNSALVTDGIVIRVAPGTTLTRPIHLVHVATGSACVRHIIDIGDGSEVNLIEAHVSSGDAARFENAVSMISLGAGARLNHSVLIETPAGSIHLGNAIVSLAKEATYRPFQFSTGAGLLRQQGTISFEGEHAMFDFSAAQIVPSQGHHDTTLVIDHKVPHCTSRELVKAVLAGTGRGVFQGKVIVQPGAQKTDGKQMAQALMLSNDAEFLSKPELEIYADDVVCGHGSTTAEIDPDLIFYCRSRGIPEDVARALLIESFIGEAVERIEHDTLREAVMARAVAILRADTRVS